ncbi:TMEM175 family protein [Chryseobacterium sp. C-71]|uniref:TMEM175 family protein n=1 Tax=Chryseobacterium sp. C-71 TaxID=2893882 RepID=UPI001E52113F|nr:TMEM175 family protein [Chryseobacterium sp. C-71]UFH30715.1 TMEM175 family protein [Chryseobacterium sp. C-71]
MKTSRLEAFSDGVIAIIITIMVLELKAPEETNLKGLISIAPIFISYLSFIYVGIYWNSHHHLFQITEKVNGKILWANLHLLFWLSLIPFTTSWIGENHIEAMSVSLYGFVFLMSAIAFLILKIQILKSSEKTATIHQMIGSHKKEYLSFAIYIVGICLAFINTYIAIIGFMFVGVVWFLPDAKIEREISN